MADHQLPAYLQNRQVRDFTDYAADGLGTVLPPHVSIQGNMFTLVDAAGQEYQPLATMEAVIVDRSNFACKMYYDKPWVPGSDEPPVCWSTNGIGPSKDAPIPQSRSCGECQFNVRGSAISKISGASIKACRDEYHMALLLPSIPDMMFRYVLTPGSFENWQNYTAKFKNSNVKISMVVTQMSFQPKVNGVVMFNSLVYVDEATNRLVEQILREKKTDALVGRNDVPRTTMLAAPVQQINGPYASAPNQAAGVGDFNQSMPAPQIAMQQPAQQVQQPAPFVSPGAFGSAPIAASPSTNTPMPLSNPAPVQPALPTSPSEPTLATTPRRRRRTAAEMQAAQPQGQSGPATTGTTAAPQAPFPHPGQAAPQTSSQGTVGQAGGFPVSQQPGALPSQTDMGFGMAQGQPVGANPEVSAMLDDFFKQG